MQASTTFCVAFCQIAGRDNSLNAAKASASPPFISSLDIHKSNDGQAAKDFAYLDEMPTPANMIGVSHDCASLKGAVFG